MNLKYKELDCSVKRTCKICDGVGKLWSISSKVWPYGRLEPIVVPSVQKCHVCEGTGNINVTYIQYVVVN